MRAWKSKNYKPGNSAEEIHETITDQLCFESGMKWSLGEVIMEAQVVQHTANFSAVFMFHI